MKIKPLIALLIIISFVIRRNCPESYNKFLNSYLFNRRKCFLKLFRTLLDKFLDTSQQISEKLFFQPTEVFLYNFSGHFQNHTLKQLSSFRKHELSIFNSCSRKCLSGQLSIKVYAMFMITTLIVPCMGKLIGENCPELRDELLNSYFLSLPLESSCLELCFWRVTFKTILTQ